MGQPSVDQEAWLLGADDCGADPDDCTFVTPCGTPESYAIDTIFMVRVLVSNQGNKTSGSVDWSLWFAPNDAPEDLAIVQVTGASATIQIADSSSLIKAADVGTALCSGTGTWKNGEHCELTDVVVPSFELTGSDTTAQYTELQFAVKFVAGASGTHYLFVRYAGTVLEAHTAGGVQVTVEAAAPEQETVTGTQRFLGTLLRRIGFHRTVEGAPRFLGALLRRVGFHRTVEGAPRLSAALTRRVGFHRTIVGAIRFAGVLTYSVGAEFIQKTVTGAQRLASTLIRKLMAKRTVEGTQRFTGALLRSWYRGQKSTQGTQKFTGETLKRAAFHRTVGTIT